MLKVNFSRFEGATSTVRPQEASCYSRGSRGASLSVPENVLGTAVLCAEHPENRSLSRSEKARRAFAKEARMCDVGESRSLLISHFVARSTSLRTTEKIPEKVEKRSEISHKSDADNGDRE